MNATYVVGIDLGTTNSVLAYTRLDAKRPRVELLPIPQLVDLGTVESRPSLPSFTYLGDERQASSHGLDLPWAARRTFAVGELARRQAAETPDRTICAAKSWLSHGGIDRRQPVLPWQTPADVEKISPLSAAQHYLEHLVDAWAAAFPDAPLAEQAVVLTVPASFDAVARELTREAAVTAGLPADLLLVEEPQAALYCWLAAKGDRWRDVLSVGDRLLVCDVGGGTTDLTLIGVAAEDGDLALERIAVGNHLLVGGDNMDLALAHLAATRLEEQGVALDPWQSVGLWHSCRTAKETLLTPGEKSSHTISVLGRGSKLIGGTVSIDVERSQVEALLVDGFFPTCALSDGPQQHPASGFQEIGLPFESDTGITRHLAAFLNRGVDRDINDHPTHILFNGGVFKAKALRQRLLEVLNQWRSGGGKTRVLEGDWDLDHAVAKGAACYGWIKQRGGVRIRGGVPSSYYVGIETAGLAIPGAPRPLRALCVVPFGMEEGTEINVPYAEIGLVHGRPAEFRFFSSHVRHQDRPGDTLASWSEDELIETAPLTATLSADESIDEAYVPVKFQSRITELGMFELWCVSTRSDRSWKLEFNVRPPAKD